MPYIKNRENVGKIFGMHEMQVTKSYSILRRGKNIYFKYVEIHTGLNIRKGIMFIK